MTHNANKRRIHNDAARAAAKPRGGAAARERPVRDSPHGRRLAAARRGRP